MDDDRAPRREAPTGSRVRPEDAGEIWPDAPEWAEPSELGPEVLRDLRGLSKENSDFVARHLVAATSLADEEPEEAWLHARAARSKGGRIAVVRETVGLVAYRAQEWAEAISELRAARRMGGGPGHVAILADCERALGNPERALDLARSPEAAQLDEDGAAELRIVASGARADMGQLDAAMAVLQDGPGFDLETPTAYSGRLYYAYADLLLTAGQADEALQWFVRADDADDDGDTDAADRIADLIAIREGRAPATSDDPGAGADDSDDAAELSDDGTASADTDTDGDSEDVVAAPTAGIVTSVEDNDVEDSEIELTDTGTDTDTDTSVATPAADVTADVTLGVDHSADEDSAEDESADEDVDDKESADDSAGGDSAGGDSAGGELARDEQVPDGQVPDEKTGEVPIGRGSVLFSSGHDA